MFCNLSTKCDIYEIWHIVMHIRLKNNWFYLINALGPSARLKNLTSENNREKPHPNTLTLQTLKPLTLTITFSKHFKQNLFAISDWSIFVPVVFAAQILQSRRFGWVIGDALKCSQCQSSIVTGQGSCAPGTSPATDCPNPGAGQPPYIGCFIHEAKANGEATGHR